jgi:hypothetical protein
MAFASRVRFYCPLPLTLFREKTALRQQNTAVPPLLHPGATCTRAGCAYHPHTTRPVRVLKCPGRFCLFSTLTEYSHNGIGSYTKVQKAATPEAATAQSRFASCQGHVLGRVNQVATDRRHRHASAAAAIAAAAATTAAAAGERVGPVRREQHRGSIIGAYPHSTRPFSDLRLGHILRVGHILYPW